MVKHVQTLKSVGLEITNLVGFSFPFFPLLFLSASFALVLPVDIFADSPELPMPWGVTVITGDGEGAGAIGAGASEGFPEPPFSSPRLFFTRPTSFLVTS